MPSCRGSDVSLVKGLLPQQPPSWVVCTLLGKIFANISNMFLKLILANIFRTCRLSPQTCSHFIFLTNYLMMALLFIASFIYLVPRAAWGPLSVVNVPAQVSQSVNDQFFSYLFKLMQKGYFPKCSPIPPISSDMVEVGLR